MTAGKVGDQTARFAHQQFAGSKIPRLQADFKIAINAAGGDVGEIQRSGAGAAEVGALGKQLRDHIHKGRRVLLGFEREASGENRAVEIASGAAAQTVTVKLRALTAYGGEEFVAHRIVNHRHFGTAFNAYGDRNREVRQAFDKIGGAIQRIDNPLNVLIVARQFATLFSNDGVLRVGFANHFDNQSFCITVNIGNKVVAAFLARFDRVRGFIILGNQVAGLARSAHGDVEHRMHRYLSLDVKERGKTARSIAAHSLNVSTYVSMLPIISSLTPTNAAKYPNRTGGNLSHRQHGLRGPRHENHGLKQSLSG